MYMQFNEKEKALYDLLKVIPPDLNAAEAFLRSESLSPSEVTRVAIQYADDCYYDTDVCEGEPAAPLSPPALHKCTQCLSV